MSGEDCPGVDDPVFLGGGIDVPEADGVVVRRAQQVAVKVGVPGQAVALLLVPAESGVGEMVVKNKKK